MTADAARFLAPYLWTFLLILARLTPAALALPGTFPGRALLTAGCAAWLAWMAGPRDSAVHMFPAALAINLLLGSVMAAGVSLVAALWSSTGELFDSLGSPHPSRMEIPGSGQEGTPHAALLSLLGAVYFLSARGPEMLVLALGKQMEAFPPEAPWIFFAGEYSNVLVHAALLLFGTVLALALPAVLALVFLEYSLGLLSVLLPAAQPYFLAMPLRALAVEAVFWLSIPWILDVLGGMTLWGIKNVMILS